MEKQKKKIKSSLLKLKLVEFQPVQTSEIHIWNDNLLTDASQYGWILE